MSAYLYEQGSWLEVPGIEATLEYGDQSTLAHDRIPGALLINDRSTPDQVHVKDLTGLHDDPDASDSRSERASHYGERVGLLVPRGRTVGVTGDVRAGNVARMRDLWRRLRGQFGRVEQDLIVHPPYESQLYVNEAWSTSVLGWTSQMAGHSAVVPTTFTDGTITGLDFTFTSSPATTAAIAAQTTTAIPWNGEDVWISALVRSHAAAAAATSIVLGVIFFPTVNNYAPPLGVWTATGSGIIVTPVTGNYYLVQARMLASQQFAAGATSIFPTITMNRPATAGTYTLRVADFSVVKLSASEPTPAGLVSAVLPGFEYEGAALQSRSYGPCYGVNQVADVDSVSSTSWANDSTSGAIVDQPGSGASTHAWPGGGLSANYWALRVADTTPRTLAVRTPSTLADPGLFVVAGGRRYRAHVRVRVDAAFSAGALQIVWLDAAGATISTSSVATFDPVSTVSVDETLDGAAAAPSLAKRAYLRIATTSTTSASGQKLTILVTEPRFFDVSEYDPGDVDMNSAQSPEDGVSTRSIAVASGVTSFPTTGARRRVPRPFLLRSVRALWDAKAPEQQANLQYRREFTFSMRAADPRIYAREERHSHLRLSGTATLTSFPLSNYSAVLDAVPTTALADDFADATVAGSINGRHPTNFSTETWTTGGDATDYAVDANLQGSDGVKSITRSTSTAETTGRVASIGASIPANASLECRIYTADPGDSSVQGVALRYSTVTGNQVRLTVQAIEGANNAKLEKVVAGVVTTFVTKQWTRTGDVIYRLRLVTYRNGRVVAYVLDDHESLIISMSAIDADLALGGTLASGRAAIVDRSTGTTGAIARRYADFSVLALAGSTSAPTNFTDDASSYDPDVEWKSSAAGVGYPAGGAGLGPSEVRPPATGYLAAASLSRVYYSGGSVTYTTPQVTVSGDCIGFASQFTLDDIFKTSLIGGAWQYNYIGVLLKRVSASVWIEARYNSANLALMNANSGGSPTPPQSLELWCSHTAAGASGTTRLGAWDVPVASIVDGKRKYLRTYMDSTCTIWVELWSAAPNPLDDGLIVRKSFQPVGGAGSTLGGVIGPSVAGRAGMIARLARWDDGTHVGLSTSAAAAQLLDYVAPYLSSFDAVDYVTGTAYVLCPVIGDVDDVPLRLQLRGDIDTPTIVHTHLDTGVTETLRLSGVFSEADPVTVDMDAGTIVSDSGIDYFDRRQPGSRFFALKPGHNVLAVQAAGWDANDPAHLIATWRDALR